jgi:serine/threonine protein kinase
MSTLDAARWKAVSPYLEEALDLAPEERTAFLATVRTQSPEVAADLASLLAQQEAIERSGFLADPTPSADPPPRATLVGQEIGAYTLISPIGHGGMGTVWLARRSDGRFEGFAAVKLLNASLVGREGEERFRREGTILARLTHPSIARLIDAGVSPIGQPYLVLEYVRGQHIDRYCDERALDVPARIRLFLDVLTAVAHAHANLVVHRDIKPSNVLVPTSADAGAASRARPAVHVKLLDFGIARLLESEPGSESADAPPAVIITRDSGWALTPEYAAPEQLTGRAVTTATDVYSLGVLLYLLLSGRHPAGRGLLSPAELISKIVDTETPRISDAVSMDMPATTANTRDDGDVMPSTPAAVAACRNTTLEKLRHTLRGDLDTIIAKAMKKNPAERYPSVMAFAEDLQRYLDERPIAARPESLAYRALKFTRRNRLSMALAAAVLIALVGGLIGTMTQASRATRQAAFAEQQRLRADRAARTASAQRDFTLRQLSQADDTNDLSAFLIGEMAPFDRPFTPSDLLARAEQIAERQQSNDPSHVNALLSLAYQYQNLNQDEKALHVLERAYKISRSLDDRATGAKAACALAAVTALSYTEEAGPRGEQYFKEAMDALPAEPQYALHRIYCYLRGSELANASGNAPLAIERAHTAQAILKSSGLSSPSLELKLSLALAKTYNNASSYREGAEAYAEASRRMIALGRDHTRTAGMLYNNWASGLFFQGRPLEAEPRYRRAFEILTSAAADGRDFLSGWQYNYYARTLAELHRLPEAARYAEQASARSKGTTSPWMVQGVLLTRAGIYREMGDVRRAEEMLAQAEPLIKPTLTESAYMAMAASERALLAQARGDLSAALSLMSRALATVEANPHSSSVPRILMRRSAILLDMGRLEDARADADRALGLEQKRGPVSLGTSGLGRAWLTLGRVLRAQNQPEEARAALAAAVEHLTPSLGADHPETRLAKQLLNLPAVHQVAARSKG